MMKCIKMKRNSILFLIVLLGFTLRIYGINWDQGHHLHPDERFLTMVGLAEKIPPDWTSYFLPSVSSLNPYNVGHQFFVYGTFPLTLTKILAVIFRLDNYNDLTILGRFLSAVADTLMIVVIYKLAALWERQYRWDPKIKFLAGLFYALAVLPIQLAHFFAADTFLSFFMVASLYWGLCFHFSPSVKHGILSAFFFGLAVGTKITAVYILPLVLFFHLFILVKKRRPIMITGILILFVSIAYLTLRIGDPKFFASGDFTDFRLNPIFIQNLKELNALSGKDAWYPPAVQWISKKPIVFPLINIVFFGLGVPYFLLAAAGGYFFAEKRKLAVLAVGVWMISFFLYQSTRFAATMRYFIFLYPFFAIFAANGLVKILAKSQLKQIPSLDKPTKNTARHILLGRPVSGHLHILWWILLSILILLWPLSFMHIYTRKHSRVEASEWIKKHVPKTAFLAEEHWDDFLPLNGGYQGEQMPVAAPDTDEKWDQMKSVLTQADYLILTSNRGYGSIMQVPQKYPRMAKFYHDLFAGRHAFKKIKQFVSYPTLSLGFLKIELADDWAEEAFTVYDHPKVIIFKKT